MTEFFPPPAGDPPLTYLAIDSRGSREHFYHFILGVLVPLCRYLAQTGNASAPMLIKSCGPMDAILNELGLPRLVIVERESFATLGASLAPELARRIGIAGGDLGREGDSYDAAGLRSGALWLLRRLSTRVAGERSALAALWPERPRVLLIDRAPGDPYYASDRAEIKTAGAERRRIPNHAALSLTLAIRFPGFRGHFLEKTTLAFQMALFGLADIVVAQHGAALSNILWMRRDAAVVEVGGRDKIGHFTRLANLLGVADHVFPQAARFEPVDPAALAAIAATLVRNRYSNDTMTALELAEAEDLRRLAVSSTRPG